MFRCFQNVRFADGRREVAFNHLNGRSCQRPDLRLASPRLDQNEKKKSISFFNSLLRIWIESVFRQSIQRIRRVWITVNPTPGSFSRMQNSSSGSGISSQAGSSASLISWSTPSCQTPRGCCSPPASSTLPAPGPSRIGNGLWLSLGKKNTSVGLRIDSWIDYLTQIRIKKGMEWKRIDGRLRLCSKTWAVEQQGDWIRAWPQPSYRWRGPPFPGWWTSWNLPAHSHQRFWRWCRSRSSPLTERRPSHRNRHLPPNRSAGRAGVGTNRRTSSAGWGSASSEDRFPEISNHQPRWRPVLCCCAVAETVPASRCPWRRRSLAADSPCRNWRGQRCAGQRPRRRSAERMHSSGPRCCSTRSTFPRWRRRVPEDKEACPKQPALSIIKLSTSLSYRQHSSNWIQSNFQSKILEFTVKMKLPVINATAEKIQVQFGNNSGRSITSDGIIGGVEEICDLIDPAVRAGTKSVTKSSSFYWHRRFERLFQEKGNQKKKTWNESDLKLIWSWCYYFDGWPRVEVNFESQRQHGARLWAVVTEHRVAGWRIYDLIHPARLMQLLVGVRQQIIVVTVHHVTCTAFKRQSKKKISTFFFLFQTVNDGY